MQPTVSFPVLEAGFSSFNIIEVKILLKNEASLGNKIELLWQTILGKTCNAMNTLRVSTA